MHVERDDPMREDVRRLVAEHLTEMFAVGPEESVHALNPAELSAPGISLWSAREDGTLLGFGALRYGASGQSEVKSMRTTVPARGRGVAALVLARIISDARAQGAESLNLETGSQDAFAPSRRLYRRHGFTDCEPFADYRLDPNRVYMSLRLSEVLAR